MKLVFSVSNFNWLFCIIQKENKIWMNNHISNNLSWTLTYLNIFLSYLRKIMPFTLSHCKNLSRRHNKIKKMRSKHNYLYPSKLIIWRIYVSYTHGMWPLTITVIQALPPGVVLWSLTWIPMNESVWCVRSSKTDKQRSWQ